MPKIHRAWGVCLGCALLFFCTSGLVTNAFSIYLPYILSWNDFSNTQISTLLTIRNLSSFIAMFLTGAYYEHISLRRGMALSGLMIAAGFVIYGLSTNYPMYLCGAIVAGMGYGLGSMVPIGIMLDHWFETNLSFATGVCACVTGLSTLGLPSLITVLIGRIGLGKTFLCESVLIVVLIFLSWLLLADSPEDKGLKPYHKMVPEADNKDSKATNPTSVKGSADSKPAFTHPSYRPVLEGKMWLLLWPMLILLGSFTSTAYGHLSVFMTSTGISAPSAAIVILVSGLAIVPSKILYGFLSDRITAFMCNWIFGALTSIGLFLTFLASGNELLMGLGIVLYSAGLGMTTVGLVIWAKELSRPEMFARNNRYFQVGFAIGGLIFSSLPGIIADACKGSYKPAILLFAINSVLVMLMIQGIYIRARKR